MTLCMIMAETCNDAIRTGASGADLELADRVRALITETVAA